MINSLKQLIRTPFKYMGLMIIVIICNSLLILGVTIFINSMMQYNNLENSFITIGTVEQKASSTKTDSVWDAGSKSYMNYVSPSYDYIIPSDVLRINEIKYVKEPEKRPYYGAYVPTYKNNRSSQMDILNIVEFTPVEDFIPDHPVLVNVVKVHTGELNLNEQILFCDHYTENPTALEKDKTYIATIRLQDNAHKEVNGLIEWVSSKYLPFTTQIDANTNSIISNELNKAISFEEVNDDFYKLGRNEIWNHMLESFHMKDQTVPVLPTNSLSTLPSFHSKKSMVIEGREITEDEFIAGKKVCLLQNQFAQLNDLSVGDYIKLPLYFANYDLPSGYGFGTSGGYDFSLLDAKGNLFSPFSEENYEIIGIYEFSELNKVSSSSEMAFDLVIIPSNSVKESDKQHIIDYGPMHHSTTSFQIPNGTIEDFKEKFSEIDKNSFLEVNFDDGGYELMRKSIEENKTMSYILLAIGFISSVIIIMFLLYIFILKQEKRTAIEKSLGMNRRQCCLSMVGGLSISIFIASIIGCILSLVILSSNSVLNQKEDSFYNLEYSSHMVLASENTNEMDLSLQVTLIAGITPIIFTFISTYLFLYFVKRQFEKNVIDVLCTRGD